jgi:membrane protein
MRPLWQCFLHALGHAWRHCGAQAQAVAFNMFLAFFPMTLLVLSVVGNASTLRGAVQEMAASFRGVLPLGSQRVVVDFLVGQAAHPWRWTLFGVIGTLLAGTQVMKTLIDGFSLAHRDPERPSFWAREARGLVLLCATLGPWLAAALLTVFGKQARAWMVRHYGLPDVFRFVWAVLFSAGALLVAIAVLAVVYHAGRPGARSWREVLPGAVVATLLWWGVSAAFGFYVRHMRYGLVYGGLAAAIGLLLWMQLTALVVFIGASFNAELAARAQGKAGEA